MTAVQLGACQTRCVLCRLRALVPTAVGAEFGAAMVVIWALHLQQQALGPGDSTPLTHALRKLPLAGLDCF